MDPELSFAMARQILLDQTVGILNAGILFDLARPASEETTIAN